MSKQRLTGKVRYRHGSNDHPLVLQVEYLEGQLAGFSNMLVDAFWRDATVEDLTELQQLAFNNLTVNIQVPEKLPGEDKPSDPRKLH